MISKTTKTKNDDRSISIPTRTRTKNQKRIESLMQNSPRSISGLTQLMLKLPNCPKEVKISTKVLRCGSETNNNNREKTVTKKELILFMIKKFNLFYDPNANKSGSSYLTFRNYQASGVDSLLKIVNSKKYEKKQLPKITKKLYWWKQSDHLAFVGLENEHFQGWFQPPHKVNIEKTVLKQFCNESPKSKGKGKNKNKNNNNNKNSSQSSEIKKLYRAFSFFFSARYNCINTSNKSRTEMKFGRNYKSGFGNSNIANFGIDLDHHEKQIMNKKIITGEKQEKQQEQEREQEKKEKETIMVLSNFTRLISSKRTKKRFQVKKQKHSSSRKRRHSKSSSKKNRKKSSHKSRKSRHCHSHSGKHNYKSSVDKYDHSNGSDFFEKQDKEKSGDKLHFETINKIKKRKNQALLVLNSSTSSGEEMEREDYQIYSNTKNNHHQKGGKRKIRKIILTKHRNNFQSNLLGSQSMLTENENIYFEELKNKTENELEDELLSLLLNLKNVQN
ncbi:hypothetical protein M0813_06875 [Anaeramoeba flamelloides]|uniref:Uncharacterized protein n=1 Tax=Anaeramoeba flamelloides TaxID=1746091 RepID=A0ABQ8XDW9_9EUKA|nr:hypothetical protein M0813_06875 [Anaeramoeba flamelloides]